MKKLLILAAAATGLAFSSANATTMVFKGDGNNVNPLGTEGVDFVTCASPGDFCSIEDHSNGLNYTLDGIDLQVRAYAGGTISGSGDGREVESLGEFARLIQDKNPKDSGLGAFSESNSQDDQTQFGRGESIEFIFDQEYLVRNVEFNAGGDTDCTNTSDGSGEGVCGEFLFQVFDDLDNLVSVSIVDVTNLNFVNFGIGARFLLTALTEGGGFTIAQLSINEVPIPGAIPLLLSGLAGLGFASRKKKAA